MQEKSSKFRHLFQQNKPDLLLKINSNIHRTAKPSNWRPRDGEEDKDK